MKRGHLRCDSRGDLRYMTIYIGVVRGNILTFDQPNNNAADDEHQSHDNRDDNEHPLLAGRHWLFFLVVFLRAFLVIPITLGVFIFLRILGIIVLLLPIGFRVAHFFVALGLFSFATRLVVRFFVPVRLSV